MTERRWIRAWKPDGSRTPWMAGLRTEGGFNVAGAIWSDDEIECVGPQIKPPGDDDLIARALQQINVGRITGSHTGRDINIYQIAEDLLGRLTEAEIDQATLDTVIAERDRNWDEYLAERQSRLEHGAREAGYIDRLDRAESRAADLEPHAAVGVMVRRAIEQGAPDQEVASIARQAIAAQTKSKETSDAA